LNSCCSQPTPKVLIVGRLAVTAVAALCCIVGGCCDDATPQATGADASQQAAETSDLEQAAETDASQQESEMDASQPMELYVAAHSSQQSIEAREAVVSDLVARYGAPEDVAARLDPFNGEPGLRAHRLLREWNPMFFSREDIERLLGPPSKMKESVMRYAYAYGMGVGEWRFTLDARGDVCAVEYLPGE
jgi:hypothetical protein